MSPRALSARVSRLPQDRCQRAPRSPLTPNPPNPRRALQCPECQAQSRTCGTEARGGTYPSLCLRARGGGRFVTTAAPTGCQGHLRQRPSCSLAPLSCYRHAHASPPLPSGSMRPGQHPAARNEREAFLSQTAMVSRRNVSTVPKPTRSASS